MNPTSFVYLPHIIMSHTLLVKDTNTTLLFGTKQEKQDFIKEFLKPLSISYTHVTPSSFRYITPEQYTALRGWDKMSHQYSITLPYQQSDNVVFVLVDNRVNIGLNNLTIDLQFETDTNQIQFFSTVGLSVLQALLPDTEIVQEY